MILKVVAMVTMLIDHIGLFNNIYMFRIIGRLSFPIFAYLVATGTSKTRNINKYALRMLLLAIISQVIWISVGIYTLNILFSYFLFIKIIEYRSKGSKFKIGIILSIIFILAPYMDYSFYGFSLMFIFYYIKDLKLLTLSVLVANMVGYLMNMIVGIQFVSLFSIILIQIFKDEKYKKNILLNKFCYAFYPMHLLVLVII